MSESQCSTDSEEEEEEENENNSDCDYVSSNYSECEEEEDKGEDKEEDKDVDAAYGGYGPMPSVDIDVEATELPSDYFTGGNFLPLKLECSDLITSSIHKIDASISALMASSSDEEYEEDDEDSAAADVGEDSIEPYEDASTDGSDTDTESSDESETSIESQKEVGTKPQKSAGKKTTGIESDFVHCDEDFEEVKDPSGIGAAVELVSDQLLVEDFEDAEAKQLTEWFHATFNPRFARYLPILFEHGFDSIETLALTTVADLNKYCHIPVGHCTLIVKKAALQQAAIHLPPVITALPKAK